MDARDILTRLSNGELDLGEASVRLRGLDRAATGSQEPQTGAPAREPIAVIGLSARFPGSEDADQFWDHLLEGTDSVTQVPADRWPIERYHDADPGAVGTTSSKWGAFIADATAFDAEFFGMTPREAELTDPQARLFLQEAWRALENAGQLPAELAGSRCGVYAGVMLNDYVNRIERSSPHSRLPQVMQGNSNSMVTARLAYRLDLRGPTATVDTACSSSLTALHMACQSLWLDEADMMVVGGVTLYFTELPYVYMSGAGMLSPSGSERAFDAGADGIVPGEGCAVVVLKHLSRALADGDPVRAVIRASGTNSDGQTNGITAPSGASQAALIRQTYERFGVDPATIDYVECHGTGTPLGDPIEVGALNEAFRGSGAPAGSVPIGSVKSNIGHTSAAAGLAGLVKAMGVVNSGEVPPTLHQERVNPRLPLSEGPFTVADRRMTLREPPRPKRAAVSSFGFSGTNAHVVVEQPPEPPARAVSDEPAVVVLSARHPEGLAAAKRALRRWLAGPGAAAALCDVAHTLAVARTHHSHREALVVRDRAELLAALEGRQVSPAPAHLAELAQRYLAGEDVDWAEVYPPATHRRLALPGSSFADDRYAVAPEEPGGRGQSRAGTEPVPLPRQEDPRVAELTLLQPVWTHRPEPAAEAAAGAVAVHDPRGDLVAALPGAHSTSSLDTQPAAVVLRLDHAESAALVEAFEVVRGVLSSGTRDRPLTLLVLTADPALAPAAAAFLRSVCGENPRVSGRAVLVDDTGAAAAPVVQAELAAPGTLTEMCVDRRAGTREVMAWQSLHTADTRPEAFRVGGVYLVTGGAGGIGRALTAHLVDRYSARVVVCGRTPWEELAPEARPPLRAGAVRYVAADTADPDAVVELVGDILATEGELHGVLHAAGLVRDAFLTRKAPQDLEAVLRPKVDGVRALDLATRDLPLDMFVLFSSVAAVTGNIGQADYAFGNGYLDGFAHDRARLVRHGLRSGRTLSVDWPLWDGDGMSVPEPVRAFLRKQTGMEPLPVPLGLAALERLLRADEHRLGPVVSVFHGDSDSWFRHLHEQGLVGTGDESDGAMHSGGDAPHPEVAPVAPEAAQELRDRVVDAFAEALGRPPGSLAPSTTIESLGLDSLMIRTIVGELNRTVGPVGPEHVYGARDLAELAGHFSALDADPPAAAVPSGAAVPRPLGRERGYAIVGLAGRYPDAPDTATFWSNLRAGRDTVADLPTDRWAGADDVRAKGHFLRGIDRFDPEFFGLAEYESALADPQERLFLEVAWEALEDAGHAGGRLDRLEAADGTPRSVGVFVGVTSSDYQLLGAERWAHGHRTMPTGHYWSLANRLSYLLDLRGPSQPVDTACSSSLVALHMACESIQRGECAAALVGGVNLYLHPSRLRMLRQSGFLAEDGRCRSFGAGGAGFGPGEGVGAVLVKPLEDAVAHGDQIHGVVLGSAVAHGGRTNGYTAPSPDAQARVVRRALERAQVDPSTVTAVEAHGTGTELGDPVEVAALEQTYGRPGAPPCSLGSVKSAIGHGESVAGLAALTKVLLQMRHGILAPTLHADTVNPNLRLDATRFELQHEQGEWLPPLREDQTTRMPRRAGISSFGAGGVNAHVVVEEYRERRTVATGDDGPQLLVLSGPTPQHVTATAERIAEWSRKVLAAEEEVDLAALARTLREGRAAGSCRLAAVVRNTAEIAERLTSPDVPVSDLRDRSNGHALAGLLEAEDLLERLWSNGRLHAIGRLWLDGLDVPWERLGGSPPQPIVAVPPSALLSRPLWFTDQGTHAPAPHTAPAPQPAPEPAPAPGAVPWTEPQAPRQAGAPEAEAGTVAPQTSSEPSSEPAEDDEAVLTALRRITEPKIPGGTGAVDLECALPELGVDSVNLMNLRFEIDELFGLSIPLEELADQTVSQIARQIASHNGRQ
ncbi:SDR family NAD(P)-dependent oxidoreductase [Salinactinospora qingdaonensis]|uniref:Acyl transferase domain-containing protein n=1 Tax=Salinactinospora qingdaonensis TaxID=702744 RepID=A0ABP7G8I0_9ACTN